MAIAPSLSTGGQAVVDASWLRMCRGGHRRGESGRKRGYTGKAKNADLASLTVGFKFLLQRCPNVSLCVAKGPLKKK